MGVVVPGLVGTGTVGYLVRVVKGSAALIAGKFPGRVIAPVATAFPGEAVERFGQVERQACLAKEAVGLSVSQVVDLHLSFRRDQQADVGADIAVVAGEQDEDVGTPFLVSDALLLPVGIRGEELGGALAYFGSGEVIQIDVEVKERAFFDDDLSAGCGVADQAGFLAERDLEAVAFEASISPPSASRKLTSSSLPADQSSEGMTRRPF